MAEKKCCYSGIGGQAVLEGVMMKNGEKYAVAVRKPDGNIAVDVELHQEIGRSVKKIPFVRGIFNFADSLSLGMKALNFSTTFYDEESEKVTKGENVEVETTQGAIAAAPEETGKEKLSSVLITMFSVVLALGLFVFLPTYITSLFDDIVRNASLIALIEGGVRIVIFLAYVVLISLMKDIRRLYRYHGAEHKCINCIETGKPLTVKNVMESSRFHRRCGTSFLFFVVFISVILFFFIRVDTLWLRMLIRIAMIPVIAGIAYEVLRLAGRKDNFLIRLISAPGIWVQHLTTKEPDEDMVRVAIVSVEAVFDWRNYLTENFGITDLELGAGEVLDDEVSADDYEED